MLIVDRDNRHLYELYDSPWNGSQWTAGSGAFFDLNDERTPAGRLDVGRCRRPGDPARVSCGTTKCSGADEIRHAFRVTVRATNGYV